MQFLASGTSYQVAKQIREEKHQWQDSKVAWFCLLNWCD